MNRKDLGIACVAVALSLSAGCKPKPIEPAAPAPTPAARQAARPGAAEKGRAPGEAPSPAPALPREHASRAIATSLPATTEVLAVFPVAVARALVADLARLLPTLLDAADAAVLEGRLADRTGVALGTLGAECAVARIADAGVVVVCDGDKIAPPERAATWKDGDASGYEVRLLGAKVYVGVRAARVMAGTPEAVRKVLQAARNEVPTLGEGGLRWLATAKKLGYADGRRDVAVYFIAPHAAPWCGPTCGATAVFAGRDGGAIAVEEGAGAGVTGGDPASGDAAGAGRKAVDAWWKATVLPFERLRDTATSARTDPVPDEAIMAGDLPTRTAAWSERGGVSIFRGKGDALMLACLLRLDLARSLLGK